MNTTIFEDTPLEPTLSEPNQPIIRYSVTDAAIKEYQKFLAIDVSTREGYEEGKVAFRLIKSNRVDVEKRRVQLKADSLEWGRKVDAEAKRITSELLKVEEPLRMKLKAIDDEKERIKQEKLAAERKALEEAARIKAEAEAAERKAKEDAAREIAEKEAADRRAKEEAEAAERKRLADIESARLAKERAELEAERKRLEEIRREEIKRQEEARAKIEHERKELERAKAQAELEEFQRQAKKKAEEEAARELELGRLMLAEKALREEERIASERKRREAIMTDAQRLHKWAEEITMLATLAPQVDHPDAHSAKSHAKKCLDDVASFLKAFGA